MSEDKDELFKKERPEIEQFLRSCPKVIGEFFGLLESPDPAAAYTEPQQWLSFLDEWLQAQDRSTFDESDKSWLAIRLGCYVGQLLVHRHQGRWMVNDTPESASYGQIVIGDFAKAKNPLATVHPGQLATAWMGSDQSLTKLLAEVSMEICKN